MKKITGSNGRETWEEAMREEKKYKWLEIAFHTKIRIEYDKGDRIAYNSVN